MVCLWQKESIKKNITFLVAWLSLLLSLGKKTRAHRAQVLYVQCNSSFTVNMLICDTYGSAHILLGKMKCFNEMQASKENWSGENYAQRRKNMPQESVSAPHANVIYLWGMQTVITILTLSVILTALLYFWI